jgi:uncharacterized membrane protein YbhN (UPF0104 family)
MPLVAGLVVLSAVVLVALGCAAPRSSRIVRAARDDVRNGLGADRRWLGILISSIVVVAGHTTVFVIAARTAGTDLSVPRLLPLAMLVLLAMAVPTNIGGWGPREGVAAWLFAAAGLGAAQGVAAATVFGVLVLVASLPGAIVLVVARRRPEDDPRPEPVVAERDREPVGAARG